MIRVQQVKLGIDENLELMPKKLAEKLGVGVAQIKEWHVVKESIDARKEHDLHFTYTIDCAVENEKEILKRIKKDVSVATPYVYHAPEPGVVGLKDRPVVVGFGPAGMFAALLLAQQGFKPIVLERGECVEDRIKSVEAFWERGKLNPNSNVQYGEGGAGTFSDGKLTTRVKDPRVQKVLEEFVRFGAPKDILYAAHPHIGTDKLRGIVKNLREEIIRLGGEICFLEQLQDVEIIQGRLCSITTQHRKINCSQMILAIGHSARDTMRMLMKRGMYIEPKAFAIGARIEHPQEIINKAQFKSNAGHPRLKAAEYRLTHQANNGRGVYTFCMCPGGYVVPSASMEGGVVVNGMSEHARDGRNANSALLVQVRPEDYGNTPEKAIEFQETIERKAFEVGGRNYRAPAQLVEDFLAHRASTKIKEVEPSYALGVTLCDLHDILPSYVCEALEDGIKGLDKKLKGFAMGSAILSGVETRSSSPIRIVRSKEACMSTNVEGVYPCGEGAGYAGGIVSAAIDGLRCAEHIISMYHLIDEEV